MFERVAILGTGLMGGSLAAALGARLPAVHRVGYGLEPDLSQARARGLFDETADTVADAVRGADLVVLAAPISVNCALMAEVVGHLSPNALLTDLSSVKGPVVAALQAAVAQQERRTVAEREAHAGPDSATGPGAAAAEVSSGGPGVLARFVASHPIAGSEKSGPDAADAALFVGREAVLSRLPATAPDTVARLEALWRCVGARVSHMTVGEHDRVFALVSHAPHAVAFAVAGAVAVDGASPGRPDAAGQDAGADKAVRDGGEEAPIRAGDHAGPGLLDLTRIGIVPRTVGGHPVAEPDADTEGHRRGGCAAAGDSPCAADGGPSGADPATSGGGRLAPYLAAARVETTRFMMERWICRRRLRSPSMKKGRCSHQIVIGCHCINRPPSTQ